MSEKTAEFLPFNAINNFMLPEFRNEVLRLVWSQFEELPPSMKGALSQQARRLLQLPGFRNPLLAPTPIKVRGSIQPFEKSAQFTAQVLAAWAELNSQLLQQIFHLLKERNWEVLPVDTDRTRLPGFLTRWLKEENYEVIDQAFQEKYPQSNAKQNDIRLMTVWVSVRLPLELVEKGDHSPNSSS